MVFTNFGPSRRLAAVTNCGTLVRPLSKTTYQNGTVQKPYQLFSHSDQVAQYQTSISNTQAFTGWGGRIADKLTAAESGRACANDYLYLRVSNFYGRSADASDGDLQCQQHRFAEPRQCA